MPGTSSMLHSISCFLSLCLAWSPGTFCLGGRFLVLAPDIGLVLSIPTWDPVSASRAGTSILPPVALLSSVPASSRSPTRFIWPGWLLLMLKLACKPRRPWPDNTSTLRPPRWTLCALGPPHPPTSHWPSQWPGLLSNYNFLFFFPNYNSELLTPPATPELLQPATNHCQENVPMKIL